MTSTQDTTSEEYKFRIRVLKEQITKLNSMLTQEQSKNTKLQKKLEAFAPFSSMQENAIHAAKPYLTSAALEIFKHQVMNVDRHPFGRRHSEELKVMSYAIRKQSLAAYRILSNIFILPSESTLEDMLSSVKVDTGISTTILAAVELRTSKMTSWQKLAVLCIDEMNIKS